MIPIVNIIECADKVLIIGSPISLEALGHALLLKAKHPDTCSCTLIDSYGSKPIEILHKDK